MKRVPNLGLLWRRFLLWSVGSSDSGVASRAVSAFIRRLSESSPNPLFVNRLLCRRRAAIEQGRGAVFANVWTSSRLTIGSGDASVVENASITLHHVYGFPVIPGSAVKGLVQHFLLEELADFGGADKQLFGDVVPDSASRDAVAAICGPEAKVRDVATCLFGSPEQGEGFLVFHDGWPSGSPNGWVEQDVLTPHHSKYYAGSKPCANDSESPVPVPFLAVKKGVEFAVPICLSGVALHSGHPMRLLKMLPGLARDWLLEALDLWGIGSRTGAGFGRMETTEATKE